MPKISVIVESPAKAKTIKSSGQELRSDRVNGHVRDLCQRVP